MTSSVLQSQKLASSSRSSSGVSRSEENVTTVVGSMATVVPGAARRFRCGGFMAIFSPCKIQLFQPNGSVGCNTAKGCRRVLPDWGAATYTKGEREMDDDSLSSTAPNAYPFGVHEARNNQVE